VTALRIRQARRPEAARQATWIATMDPWRSLGYRAAGLARWLGRQATDGQVWLALSGRPPRVVGLVVCQPQVLLGSFISLLAVPPAEAGRGIGRALVLKTADRVFRSSRWLYTSSDRANRPAGRFYRALGFARVGLLPDLVAPGHVEILWRLGRPRATARS
jgi:ribosomal protein S18 acetylase RimI-like enzyme